MSSNLSEFLPLYIQTSKERLVSLSDNLLGLERNPDDRSILEAIFIAAHSFKGESAMMGFNHLAYLCHVIEDIFYELKSGSLTVTTELINSLLNAFDAMTAAVGQIEAGAVEPSFDGVSNELKKLTNVETAGVGPSNRSRAVAGKVQTKPVNLPVTAALNTVSVPQARLDTLLNLSESALISKFDLESALTSSDTTTARRNLKDLSRILTELEYNVTQARLVPLSVVFGPLTRLVRDLALIEHKTAEIQISGGETALDRTIIDHLSEPLVHLIRNSISHGIEDINTRVAAGKPATGQIIISAKRLADKAIIEISDDGAGVDLNSVRDKAIKDGIIDQTESVSDERLGALLWSGLTTTEKVTEVSGRGVGLPAVKQQIERLGGKVTLSFIPQAGTKFRLELPLTLAIIRVLLLKVGQHNYALPASSIKRTVMLSPANVISDASRPRLKYENSEIPLIELARLLGLPLSRPTTAVIIRQGKQLAALAVDELINQDEIIVKPLYPYLRDSRYFSGTTILGSGLVALVLDAEGIISTIARPA